MIFRTAHNKNYTCINNTIVKDKRLSWKAKGIWLYAFSRPDDWKFTIKDLVASSSDGERSVYSGLRELEESGYLVRSQGHNENGQFQEVEWTFHEVPQTLESAESPEDEKKADLPQKKIKKSLPNRRFVDAVPHRRLPRAQNVDAVNSLGDSQGKSDAHIYNILSTDRLNTNNTHTNTRARKVEKKLPSTSAVAGVCVDSSFSEDSSRELEELVQAAKDYNIPLPRTFLESKVARAGAAPVKRVFAMLYFNADEKAIASIRSHPALFTKTLNDLGVQS